MSAAPDTVNRNSHLLRIVRWFAISLGTLLLLIGLLLGAFSIAMARMPQYRAQMQTWLSERAKVNIQFATLQARWRWFGPELVFTDAVVRTADGKQTLAIAQRGGVGFDLWTALRTGRLAAGRFSLSGTELKIVRRANGKIEIVGAEDLPERENTALNLDALPVGELVVDEVRVSFRDLKTGRGPWLVNNVQFTIERDRNHVALNGQASLPATLGKQLKFSAHADGSLAKVDELQWQAQASGKQFDLKGWAQVMPDDWIAPREGTGSFDLTAQFVGSTPQSATGRINFVDVLMNPPQWTMPLPQAEALQIHEANGEVAKQPAPAEVVEPTVSEASVAAAPEALRYSQVGLEFSMGHGTQGWQTDFKNLQFVREGFAWQPSKASVLIKFADAVNSTSSSAVNSESSSAASEPDTDNTYTRVERVHATAQRIELDNLWPLLAYLPETETNARLRALNATGELGNLDINYQRDADPNTHELTTPRYGFRVDFKRIGVSPVGRTPGVSGLSGSVEATGAQGKLHLDSTDVALAIPHVFRTPLPVDRIAGNFEWARATNNLHLATQDLVVESPDGHAQAQMSLDVPQEGSPQIDMHAQAGDLNVLAAPRYMPAGVMSRSLLAWLDAAFTAGRVNKAELTLKGPLRNFPFRDNSGLFLAVGDIEGLTLNYQAGWLPGTGIHTQAEFRNNGFSAKASAGDVNGLSLDNASARMKDYRDSELEIKAQMHGDLGNSVRFVQQSPIGPAIGDLFQQLEGKGAIRATADLYLPLKEFAKRRINIDVQMDNARAGLQGVTQQATNLNGKLHVFNDAVTGASITGEFLQGPFALTTAPLGNNRFNIVANGHATSTAASQFLHVPSFVKLNGEFDYRFSMPGYPQRSDDGRRSLFVVDSDLKGLNVDMPAPVNKPAAIARPLHVETEMRNNDAMQIRASFGELRSLTRLQHANDGWRFDRAGLRVDGVAAALPSQPGLRVDGSIDEFTLDDWLKLGSNTPASSAATSGTIRHVQDVLRSANVNIGRFRLFGFEWTDVRGVLQATDQTWRVDVAGPQATGQVIVPYSFEGASPLVLNMEQLTLNSLDADDGGSGKQNKSQSTDPRELPSLLVDVKQFHYGMHDFGSLHATATHTAQGLQVNTININGESFVGSGNGSWLVANTGQQSALNLTIESTDLRETMQQFKYAEFIAAKHGKLEAHLTWPGGIEGNPLARASGSMELQVDDGQLLNLQPGAGRVLGLLSVAALPRRLKLDFRDVLDKGLGFDSIHGNFDVSNGNAHTQNFLLRGPAAEVGMVGRIGLGARDYDQTAVVTGQLGSALPIAGAAIAANPVVGAALLLFTQVFKEPLKGVTRAYYHIGGSWDDPQVERVDSDVGKASMSTTTPDTPTTP